MVVTEALKKYIEKNIFPAHKNNDEGHSIDHIEYVIDRSFKLVKENKLEGNIDMVYTAAAYHDIGHYIDPLKHEIVSAKIMFEDKKLREFFNEEQLVIMKEAIEDHRASNENIPRSIYGKILSSADRSTNIESVIWRTYYYRKKHGSHVTLDSIIEDAYIHVRDKFGENGYGKSHFNDIDYSNFKKQVKDLVENKDKFIEKYKKLINSK